MRIAIYGGSFNPIHKGHTALANAICRMGLADEVWLMVSPLNPLKQDRQQLILPAFQRITLARIATAQLPRLHVSDFELTLPTPSYTATTLEYLESVWPTHQFSLLMGEDNWRNFNQWFRADYIKAHHNLIVYARANQDFPTQPSQAATVTLHRPDGSQQTLTHPHLRLYPISSTQIRQAILQGNQPFLRQWLHGNVANYILRHALYTTP